MRSFEAAYGLHAEEEGVFQKERLTFARKRRQMTQTDLAKKLEVTPRTIQRYEKGDEEPKDEKLEQLAHALRFPAEFFLDSRPLPDIPAPSLSFRAYSKIKARLRENAVAVSQICVGIEAVLNDHFELPELAVPDLSECATSPEHAAQLLREEWALGSRPIANVVHVLEAKGVRVFSLTEDAQDVDAFCFWQDHTPFVVLNLLKSVERGRFDGAHELGHLVLHRHIDFRGKDVEREANEFASEFLVPRSALLAQLPPTLTLATVHKLKAFWKVSAMAMVKRLKDVGKLSDWVYRSMCMQLSKDGYRLREMNGLTERETSSLLSEMLGEEEATSVGAIARALNLHARDISPIVFGLPFVRGHLRLLSG